MSLEIKGLNKKFDNLSLFSDFSIEFQEGTITCILGPSGCGKTTLLNIIGDTIKPDSGQLSGFRGKTISYIFQDPRLLPWKTVEENIDFVLTREMPADQRHRITGQLIRLMELEDFAGFYPSKLSGGMRQRVSIARAFAYPSEIILMDEPLKGLDIKLKLNLIRIFSRMWQADKRTVIFVTHDVDEALLLGSDIIVLSRAPARIIHKKQIDIPFENRSLESDYFRELEKNLMIALGN
ncbi:MAG: ABC transporter ATP-binding protein [Bacteroidales bacterium]|jgi:NitT/TauT family transport system ATP-binding protein|nr:ABC transporter ATP-binding protein [Bacteroidales bacterium]